MATSQTRDPQSRPIAAPPSTSTGQCAPMYILLPAMSTANAAPTMRWGRLIHGHSADTMATDTAVCAEG